MSSEEGLAPGTVVGGFRIGERLGAGGMGTVYLARQLSLDREVALKVLAPALTGDPVARQRFLQEGQLAARVQHRSLVGVLDVLEAGPHLLLALELVRGETLRARLGREPRLTLDECWKIATTGAEVLGALHAQLLEQAAPLADDFTDTLTRIRDDSK